jgi:hypothetical protein
MNKMKIAILSLATGLSTTFAADVEQSDFYINIEGGYPSLVSINVGHRSQKDQNGLDLGVGGSPIIYVLNAYGYANYLYYPNPDPYSQYYIGVGSQVGYGIVGPKFFDNFSWYAKPQLLVGKEFQINGREKHFIQLAGGNYFSGKHDFNPSLTLSYGFKY